MRWIAYAIAAFLFMTGNITDTGELARVAADWQWFLLLWIGIPLSIIMVIAVSLGVGTIAKDATKSNGWAALGVGGFSIFLIVVMGTGVLLSLAEAHFLWLAYQNSTDITQFNSTYLVIWAGLIVLSVVRRLLVKSAINNSSS